MNIITETGFVKFEPKTLNDKIQQSAYLDWRNLALEIPEILKYKNTNDDTDNSKKQTQFDIFCDKIKNLEEYKTDNLDETFSPDEQKFLLRDLLFILNATISSEGFNENSRIPTNLSNAINNLSTKLNLPPFLNYNLYVLHNFIENEKDPLLSFTDHSMHSNNVDVLTEEIKKQNPKHNDEHYFINIHKEVELQLARSLQNLELIMNYPETSYENEGPEKEEINKLMKEIAEDFTKTKMIIKKMYFGNSKASFGCYRHYFTGSDQLQTADGKKGVYDESNKLVTCHNGLSGAQSSSIQMLDAMFLDDKPRAEKAINFIQQNRLSLPATHQNKIKDVENYRSRIGFGKLSKIENFNSARKAIDNFRNSHFNLARSYIGTSEGTGGSDGLDLLSSLRYNLPNNKTAQKKELERIKNREENKECSMV